MHAVSMLLEATSEFASRITGAIRGAARATGASFEYLLKTAQRESNLNPAAKASTSSASGLFQFIDQTWLHTLKTAGPELGYAQQAEGIARTPSGRYVVVDPSQRRDIMRLRNDPAAASAMAGAFTQQNAAMLTERLGRAPSDGELYIAHFLGPTGAVQLINAAEQNPNSRAAALFPKAARANRSIFYAKGAPRNAAQVYDILVAKHQNTRTPPGMAAPAQVATAERPATKRAVASASATAAAAELALPVHARAYAADNGPVFHGLFRTERVTPVSSTVSELWTAKSVQNPARARPPAQAEAATGRPLQLFQFLRPEIRTPSRGSA